MWLVFTHYSSYWLAIAHAKSLHDSYKETFLLNIELVSTHIVCYDNTRKMLYQTKINPVSLHLPFSFFCKSDIISSFSAQTMFLMYRVVLCMSREASRQTQAERARVLQARGSHKPELG